jgi:ribose transport system ATP-binding protein
VTETPVLEARGLRKSFGGVHAVRGVDIAFLPGRVHALLGENGAGKSTTVNMLCGALVPDEGEIVVEGQPAVLSGPAVAQQHGIRTVHQELELAEALSVAENVFLGRLVTSGGRVDRDAMDRATSDLLRDLGTTISPRALVRSLSVADKQVVEIARALAAGPKLLILDEPTAALSPTEIDGLMAAIRRLTERGVGVVYISHRLDEVLGIADDITVLRDGQVVSRLQAAATNRDAVIAAMLGKELQAMSPPVPTEHAEAYLEVSGLSVGQRVRNATFNAARGEIVGFFGLAGSGHEQIAQAMFGCSSEDVSVEEVTLGTRRGLPTSPRAAIRAGLGYVPSDRKHSGLALNLSVSENLLLAFRRTVSRGLLRDKKSEARVVASLVDRYHIKVSSPKAPASSLSGGNQQKIVLARWGVSEEVQVLLLCEPTRGVDVGAKAEIYKLLQDFVEKGGVSLLFTTDPDEVAAICDRTYVISHGSIVDRHFVAGAFDTDQLIAAAM